MSEKFEIFDDAGNPLGLKERSQVHLDGDWHSALEVHLVDPRFGGTIIFQQRKSTKDVEPEKLGAAAAGHYKPGETFEDGLREVEEEINVNVSDVIKNTLGRFYRIEGKRTFVLEKNAIINSEGKAIAPVFNREFQDIGILVTEIDLEQLKMQQSELEGLLRFKNQDVYDLFAGKTDSISQLEGIQFDEEGGIIAHKKQSWSREDFTANLDNYYYKISGMVAKILGGDTSGLDWQNYK